MALNLRVQVRLYVTAIASDDVVSDTQKVRAKIGAPLTQGMRLIEYPKGRRAVF